MIIQTRCRQDAHSIITEIDSTNQIITIAALKTSTMTMGSYL